MSASRSTRRALAIADAILAVGGEHVPTGGGCTAWQIPIPGSSRVILLTEPGIARAPESLHAPCMAGEYDEDGVPVAEVQAFDRVLDALRHLATTYSLGAR